ncbi:DinB family protein [Evansella clarkii]|uniref:DinB family protein n=1 Tax=Evansella clarkii TaxID=79879 RepID=UPI000B452843|nr:DinB family protein [Evansella clarkii]
MSKSDNFVNYFLSHRNVTDELAAKISKEDYDYKPTETSMSAKTLVTHMLTSFYQFASAAAKQEAKKLHDENEEVDLQQLTKLYTDETVKVIQSMSDEDFDAMVDMTKMLGAELPAGQLLRIAMDHEINHKGNLFVYVRDLGHTDLPMFVSRG